MRTSRAVAIAAAVSTLLLAYYAISWAQVTPLRERGTDFSASYVAALVLRDGDGAQLYNQQVEHARHLSLLPAGTVIDLPFITPPTSALLALPLTALDPGTAFRVWSVIELLLLALAVWIAIRAGPWPASSGRSPRVATALVALAAGGTYAFLVLGQIDGVTALGLAAAYLAWRKDRPAFAGFWMALAFAATKPHLAIGLGVWLVARRDWRALSGALAGSAVVAAVSLGSWDRVELGGFIVGPRLRRRQHARSEHARHSGPRGVVAGRRDRRGGHRDRRDRSSRSPGAGCLAPGRAVSQVRSRSRSPGLWHCRSWRHRICCHTTS